MIPQLGTFGSSGTLVTGPIEPDQTQAEKHPHQPLAPPSAANDTANATVRPVASAPDGDLQPSLLPSNPNAPAGPPPTFEASILDRAREALVTPPDLVQRTPEQSAPPEPSDPYEVPPSRAERAADDVTTLRRIETPYDTAKVDVSR